MDNTARRTWSQINVESTPCNLHLTKVLLDTRYVLIHVEYIYRRVGGGCPKDVEREEEIEEEEKKKTPVP
jgi:hypothetical protein